MGALGWGFVLSIVKLVMFAVAVGVVVKGMMIMSQTPSPPCGPNAEMDHIHLALRLLKDC